MNVDDEDEIIEIKNDVENIGLYRDKSKQSDEESVFQTRPALSGGSSEDERIVSPSNETGIIRYSELKTNQTFN